MITEGGDSALMRAHLESCILLWGPPHGRDGDLRDAEARNKDEHRAGAALPQKQAEGVGVAQPGGEEASSLLKGDNRWRGAFHKDISDRARENGFHLKEGKYKE